MKTRWTDAGVALTLALAALVAFAAAWPIQGHEAAYWVCVTNEHSGDLSVIDGATRRVVATIPLGKRPRGVHASPDGRTLYVALSGSVPTGPPGAIASPAPARPAPQPDRSADAIGVVDLLHRRMVGSIRAGVDPEEFAISPDGRRLVVSNEDAATATALRLPDGALEGAVQVHQEPEGVAFTPGGGQVYVTCEDDGAVFVIDAHTLKPQARIAVGGRPRSIAFTPDGARAWIPSETGATVHEIDTARHTLLRTIKLAAGSRPMKIRLSRDGRELYVSNGRAGTVSIVDLARGWIRATVHTGTRPWGLDLSPDGRLLYVANGPSNDVSVVDVQKGVEIARIPAGEGPWGIAVVQPLRGGIRS
jgi:YVTN family beta-propeller protein